MQRRLLMQRIAAGAFLVPELGFSANTSGDAKEVGPPMEHFARRPLMEQVRLSPDGKKMAAIINNGTQSVLISRSIAGGGIATILSTDNLEFIFNWFRWVNNERLVVSLRYPFQRKIPYSQKVVPTMETRLLSIDADGSNGINVLRSKGLSGSTGWAVDQDNVIDWLPEDGQHILLTLPENDFDREASVYKVNVYTGQRQHYHGTIPDVISWATDRSHRVRVGYAVGEKSETTIWVSDVEGKNWRILQRSSAFAKTQVTPIGFGLDPNILYVNAQHDGLVALHTVDLAASALEYKLKLSHPRFDLDGSLLHNAAGEAIGVANGTALDSTVYYWDATYQAWQEQIDLALPGRRNFISHVNRSESACVIFSESPDRPAEFFLSSKETVNTRLLSRRYPELHAKTLSSKKEFNFIARDGLKIPCYLSLPPGTEGTNLPLVVFPHGGPQYSDGPEFDYWVAFMASRGFAVLQVNFRGSTGYGKAFMDAGLRRWGLEMQDDLTDGVLELKKLGVIDASRVAIVGASYGGYAALMGVCKTPQLYKGAFAFAPVTDLIELTAEAGQFSRREVVRRQIGEASDDRKRLRETSPRFHADQITVPVVLVHGTHDRQAGHSHSVWMAEALREKGKKYQFISLDRGDHQLSHLPYRHQLFSLLDTFLTDVLGTNQSANNS